MFKIHSGFFSAKCLLPSIQFDVKTDVHQNHEFKSQTSCLCIVTVTHSFKRFFNTLYCHLIIRY